jgi:hypothetical protein
MACTGLTIWREGACIHGTEHDGTTKTLLSA